VDVPVGSGRSRTIRELAQVALDAAGVDATIVSEGEAVEVSNPSHPQADTRAIRRLGWKETLTIEQLMKSMVEAAVLGD
jgi:nucleoside-diphosphate-sugar epimerase